MSERISGQVTWIRLFDSGWGILHVRAGSGDTETKVTGTPLGVKLGDTIEATGRWDDHPRFGRQFKAQSIRTVIPSDSAGAIGWIASHMPGIGRKRAAQLVAAHGLPKIWEVLADPAELAELPGINARRAETIAAEYAEKQSGREEAVELRGWGLTDGQINTVRNAWGRDAIKKLRADPYLLIEEVRGFGFKRADAVAQRMGLAADHPSRIDAAILHLLTEAEGAGHCYVPNGKLLRMACALLGGLSIEVVGPRLKHVCDGERGSRVGSKIYRASTMAAEQRIAAKVRRMLERSKAKKSGEEAGEKKSERNNEGAGSAEREAA